MIHLVMGGQYGSEGKGSFAHWYGQRQQIKIWGRAGGSQAGHSVQLASGRVVKLRQLPVGALIPGTTSVVGAGAVVDPELLEFEISEVESINGEAPFVIVDPMATVLHPGAAEREDIGGLVERIGSTGEGVGAARATRIWRDADTMGSIDSGRWTLQPVGHYLGGMAKARSDILIEGTQGAALSLNSPFYPFVTSHSTHPYQLLADMEIPYGVANVTILGVFRTFPIRVGGNSGSLYAETDWETLQAKYGEHIPKEQTTVTQRTRRVGEWDPGLAAWGRAYLNSHQHVLTFVDYPFPEIQHQVTGTLPSEVVAYIQEKENDLGAMITFIGTGFGTYLSRWEGGW